MTPTPLDTILLAAAALFLVAVAGTATIIAVRTLLRAVRTGVGWTLDAVASHPRLRRCRNCGRIATDRHDYCPRCDYATLE